MASQQDIPVSWRPRGEKFALGMRIVSSEDARKGALRQMSASVSEPAHSDSGQSAASSSTEQPREVLNVAVLAESELGSEAQRERRKRILDATTAIASKGGYEAVQMRAVADRADVAVGTLYRYFPSKVHLLVSALGREFERIDAKTDRSTLTGATSHQRLNFVVSKLNRAMQRNPLLTEAMTRAYVFADASAAGEVDYVEKLIDSMFARAMSDGEPTEDQYHIARVISDVWTSNLLAWLTRRASATDVSKRLELAVRLLIGNGEHSEV
jgi:TetR/AcrR family transcriptional regulator, cholesterol catabolism regulator